jgi:hypothetical protein
MTGWLAGYTTLINCPYFKKTYQDSSRSECVDLREAKSTAIIAKIA